MTDIHTTYDVLVLGDVDVDQRLDMLAEKAAERGAVITQTFAFPTGEAAQHDDLTEVEAVIEALGRAIATRTPIWLPWWHQDLCREQHLRRLGLTMQRHGLDLLIGPNLEPCPVEGGINEIDSALRNEVRSVYALDDAAMARAGMHALGPEIEAALIDAGQRPAERIFSTADVAALLGKSASWVSRGLREKTFVYDDGSAVEPLRVTGRSGLRFDAAMVRAIALSAFRRGAVSALLLEGVLAELARGER